MAGYGERARESFTAAESLPSDLSHLPLGKVRSPAVIFGNAGGDHLMTLPAIRALASLFPSRLTLVSLPRLQQVFFSDLAFRRVCEVRMTTRGKKRSFDADAVRRRIGACDLLISLNPWKSRSLDRLARLMSPALTVGFSPAFDVAFRKRETEHAADAAFRAPAYFDSTLRIEDFAQPFRLPPRVGPSIRSYLKAHARGRRVLAVHNETKRGKVWPAKRMSKLAIAFLKRHPDFVIFVLDFRKRGILAPGFEDRLLHSRGLPLELAFGVVRESDLFLGVDSVMLHAADLFRVPGVGLFGPTSPEKFGFRFARHRHLRDRRGMNYVREEGVLKALESLLR